MSYAVHTNEQAADMCRKVRRLPGLTIFLCGMVGACSESIDRSLATSISDSAGIKIATSVISPRSPVCEVSESSRIGSLDGETGVPLFEVNGAAVLADGRLAVLNRGTSEVFVISGAGELLSRFGREGDGPSEFRNLWSVHVRNPDTLVVGDYRPWRFTFYTPEGEFIRRVALDPPEIERPDYAMPLVAGSGFMMEQPHFEVGGEMVDRVVPLQTYGEDGQSTGVLSNFWLDRFGLLSPEIRYVGNPVFGARGRLAALPSGGVLYATGRHEQLEIWSLSGTLQQIVRWTARSREVEPGAVEAWRRGRRAEFEARFGLTPELERLLEAQTGPQLPVAELYPGHGDVVVGRDGSYWVEEYRRPGDEGPARWFRFDENGRLQCVAALDSEPRILAATTDRLYGLLRDALDVEYIVVYDIGNAQPL